MATTTAKRKAKKAAKSKAAKKPAKKAAAKKQPAKQAAYVPPCGAGTFCWRELMTSDVPGATKFYGALFGWTAQDAGFGGGNSYSMWQRGKDGVGGLMALPQPGVPPQWLPYVEVENVDACVAKLPSLGGQVVMPPMDIPNDHGRCAVVKDPQGAALGIWSMPGA